MGSWLRLSGTSDCEKNNLASMANFNHDQVSAMAWVACGGAIAWVSAGYGLGSLAAPGSGFITFLAGMGICFFASIGLVEATLRNRKEHRWQPVLKGVRWEKTFLVMGALTAYALLLTSLGFILCTALFVGFMLRVVKPQGWLVVIGGGIMAALGTYGIFELWLKAQLPKGPLGF
jgi:putative tricarboxylic transport membrane protein